MPVVDVNPAGDLSVTRVRVYDSRRKQKWFDPAPSIMDTPIGSPEHTPQNLIPEPLLQDILELISENDVDRNVHRDNNDISLDMALDELGLSHADLGGICHSEVVENVDGGYYRDEDDDDDNHVTDEENLHYLDSLLQESIEMTESDCSSTNYILDNTPPPTNPPSPPEPMSEEEEESSEMYINIENSPSKTLKQAKSILEESIIIKHEPVDVEEEEEEEEEVEEEEEEEVDEEEEDMDSGFIIRKDPDEELYDGLMIKKEPVEELFENFFPEFKERKRSSSETIKHDCMWNGVCCSKNEDFGFDDFLEFGKGTSFEVFDNFEETVVKRRRKSSEVEEPTVECEVDVEDDAEEVDVEDIKIKVEIDDDFELDNIRSACNNDHSYAMPHGTDLDTNSCGSSSGGSSTNSSFKKINFLNIKKKSNLMKGIVIKQEDDGGPGDMFYSNSLNNQSNSHQQPKKTKILVPLKDLMETLQQKSFLVAPLGPGKKVIRLTGSETVKGVLGMTPPIASSTCNQTTTTITPHKKNVRKRPHPPNPPTPPMFPTQQPILPVTPPAPPKKKTKAHNNMERMRRIDLRNSFDNLKKLVPPLCKANKCSKVEILRRAEEYIRALRSLEKRLVKEELSVKCKNDSLRVRLSQLSS